MGEESARMKVEVEGVEGVEERTGGWGMGYMRNGLYEERRRPVVATLVGPQ
jgi:hypothetical protein